MGPAGSSTSAHPTFETVRFPGCSFMPKVPAEHATYRERGKPGKGSPSMEGVRVRVFVLGEAGRLQVKGEKDSRQTVGEKTQRLK